MSGGGDAAAGGGTSYQSFTYTPPPEKKSRRKKDEGGAEVQAAAPEVPASVNHFKLDSSYASTSAAATAAGGTKAKPARIAADQVKYHQEMCMKLNAFALHPRFGPPIKTAGLKVVDIDCKSVKELEELLNRCRVVAMNSGSNGGMMHQMAYGACKTVEVMSPPRLCDLTGFAARVDEDEEAKMLLDLAAIDYGFATSMPLPIRIASCLGKIGMKVASENKALVEARAGAARLRQELDEMKHRSAAPPPPPSSSVIAPLPPVASPVAAPIAARPVRAIPAYD